MAEQLPFGDIELATNPEPRCACVLLLDVSGSMAEIVGEAGRDLGYNVQQDGKNYRAVSGGRTRIDLLNDGLQTYKSELMSDSLASQRVEVAIVTFGGRVETAVPFSLAQSFQPPVLSATGDTPMGKAISSAIDLVNERKQVYKQQGLHYFRPWIFLITDGEPTDEWRGASELVKKGEANKNFAFFAVGVEGANFEVLGQIATREPLRLSGLRFRDLFVWLSQSQRTVSQSQPGMEHNVTFTNPTAPGGWASL